MWQDIRYSLISIDYALMLLRHWLSGILPRWAV